MTIVIRILSVLFGMPEELDGDGRIAAYMLRWTALRTRWGKLYVHLFLGDDWSFDLHDHPKRFTSIGLWGQYDEWTPQPTEPKSQWQLNDRRRFKAPWIRSFPAEHIHRITLPAGPCLTLVWVGKPEREWGFWYHESDGRKSWIQWERYVRGDCSYLADQRTRRP